MSGDYYEGAVRRFQANPPTLEEVDELARRAQRGDGKAREELVEALAGMAELASSKHLKLAQFRGLEHDDLRQEAVCAILKGLATWNADIATFRTYAFDRAKYAVSDAINRAHLISIPKQYADPAARGTEPKDFARLKPATRLAARRAVEIPVELVPATDEDPGCDPGELEEGYEVATTRLAVEQVLSRKNTLTAREKEVLRAMYGLFGAEKKTEQEVGEEFGVSPQRIGALKRRALEKLSLSNRRRIPRIAS